MNEVLKREKLLAELDQVRQLSQDGLLHPEQAVAWARNNKDSSLFKELEWDDTAAAEKFRIEQVRSIIRVVVVKSDETAKMIRAYVSQPTDRAHGGGYRRVEDSLMRARQELIADALNTLRKFGNRYTHLPELAPVFSAIDKIVADFASAAVAKVA